MAVTGGKTGKYWENALTTGKKPFLEKSEF